MTIFERIRYLRRQKGMSQEELAKLVGYEGRSAISKVESGERDISQSMIAKYASALGVSPTYLLFGEESDSPAPDGDAIDLSKLKNVRRINPRRFPLLGKIACGQPILAVEEHDSYITADRDIDADFCVIAKGDSMRQSRICDGDTVFIRRMQAVGEIRNVAAAGVVAIIIDDEVTLKRVYYNKDNDTLILADDNSKRPPILLNGSEIDNLNCIGRAVCFMSLL